MKKTSDYWEVIDPVWDQIDIYDGPDIFLNTYSAVEPLVGQLYAAHFAQSEIRNGGFHQLFGNSTGVLCPEAVQGFELVGMTKTASLLASAMEALSSPFPRERGERQKALESVPKSLLNQLDKQFFKEIETENDGFIAAANAFVGKFGE